MVACFQNVCFHLLYCGTLLGQSQPDSAQDTRQTSAVLLMGIAGLFILFAGVLMMFWLFSRYMRRLVRGQSNSLSGSSYAEFGYHYNEFLLREQLRRERNLDDETQDAPNQNAPVQDDWKK